MSGAPRIVAHVEHCEAMLKAIRARVAELGITWETLEAIAGLQSGYASKILADPPAKRMGPFTLFLILQAVGLSVQLIENPQVMKSLGNRLVLRKLPRVRASARIIELTPDFLRLRASQGGFARAQILTKKQRVRIGRRANRIRWARVRMQTN